MLALQQHYDQEWDNGFQIIYCYIPFYEFAMSFIGMHARKNAFKLNFNYVSSLAEECKGIWTSTVL